MAAVLVHRRTLIFAVVLSWISLDPAWGATDPLASWTNDPAKQARAATMREYAYGRAPKIGMKAAVSRPTPPRASWPGRRRP